MAAPIIALPVVHASTGHFSATIGLPIVLIAVVVLIIFFVIFFVRRRR